MDNFFKYFYQDIGRVFRALMDIVSSFFNFMNYLFNFPMRMQIIQEYDDSFTTGEWIMLVITEIVVIVLCVVIIYFILKLLRKVFRFRVSVKKHDELVKQYKSLQKDLIRANYEKDRLLQMRVAEIGVPADELEAALNGEGGEKKEEEFVPDSNRNTMQSPCLDPSESRFFRLTSVDNFYKTEYQAPAYNNDITLPEFCEKFRLFSASRLRLYYDLDMMRYFVASMGTARIIILQGISGTGKTSLPYAFGKFVQLDTTVVSVQPSWRERTELYGYYNEFTKKYTETDFLRAIYEGNFYRDPHIVILDEMNIARVEYYFAEMLSILELPRKDEQKVDVVTAVWDNDPVLIEGGTIPIPDNVWFVGTINNDDSTFAVADKVYDRAIPIDLDSRADAFECEDTEPVFVSTDRLNELFDEAKATYKVSAENMAKLELLNRFLIANFHLAFGNRIMKQIGDFVPCFMGCGGTELHAIDFIVAKKVLRKFESLSLGFMKDELTQFNDYLDELFGRDSMPICKGYVEYLKKNN
ncbi:MAG: AAA family ATPase [Oscillospiraceae bacterium]|nr:AAA family ATPase [Oscillospiraceae bacterium]